MFTSKMKDLPISDDAKVFYLSNCLKDADFVGVQLKSVRNFRKCDLTLNMQYNTSQSSSKVRRMTPFIATNLLRMQ